VALGLQIEREKGKGGRHGKKGARRIKKGERERQEGPSFKKKAAGSLTSFRFSFSSPLTFYFPPPLL